MKRGKWFGHPDIDFIWFNEWNDPQLEYKGDRYNCVAIEDAVFDTFIEDGNDKDDEEGFKRYVLDNAIDYLEDVKYSTNPL